MAGRQSSEEAVNARVAHAKAKLIALAQEAESRPGAAEQTATMVRANPWRGVGIALLVGFYFGLTRGAGLRTLAPVVTPLLGGFALSALRGAGLVPPPPAAPTTVPPTNVRAVRKP
jgi:hypothetical protein